MSTDSSFALVISRLRAGDQDAATEVFRRFVHRLIALASHQFDARCRSKEDPEDVVLSVLKSFFLRDDRSPFDLADWEELWSLLAMITVRKCVDRRLFWKAERRNPARELAPSSAPADESQGAWFEAIAQDPTPEQAMILAETLELLVSRLHPSHRGIAELYFQGFPHADIAERCDCSERTVGRAADRIRTILQQLETEDLGDCPNSRTQGRFVFTI